MVKELKIADGVYDTQGVNTEVEIYLVLKSIDATLKLIEANTRKV